MVRQWKAWRSTLTVKACCCDTKNSLHDRTTWHHVEPSNCEVEWVILTWVILITTLRCCGFTERLDVLAYFRGAFLLLERRFLVGGSTVEPKRANTVCSLAHFRWPSSNLLKNFVTISVLVSYPQRTPNLRESSLPTVEDRQHVRTHP